MSDYVQVAVAVRVHVHADDYVKVNKNVGLGNCFLGRLAQWGGLSIEYLGEGFGVQAKGSGPLRVLVTTRPGMHMPLTASAIARSC